jgi:hypothetical protein
MRRAVALVAFVAFAGLLPLGARGAEPGPRAAKKAAATPPGTAVAMLARPGAAADAGAHAYPVSLGKFTDRDGKSAEGLAGLLRARLDDRMRKAPARFRLIGPAVGPSAAASTRLPTAEAFVLHGAIKRVTTRYTARGTTVTLAVSLMATRSPGDALVGACSAEAEVTSDGATTAADDTMLRRDALAAATDEAFDGLFRALAAPRAVALAER